MRSIGRVVDMTRLTRDESRRHNRDLLLRSARTLFMRDGYNATSLAAVADEAGFSTGVVYSNFAGKAELALLVLREIQGEQLGALRRILAADGSIAAKLDGFREWAESAFSSGWPRLELEFALDARADDDLVAAEAERHEAAVGLATDTLAAIVPDDLASLIPLKALAEALVSLAIGVAVRRLIDPSVRPDALIDALGDLLESLAPVPH